MILTTTEDIPGREYEIIGIVRGGTVQTKNLGKDILSGLKGLVGGEITAYSDMMNEARAIATRRMVEDAESQGADAIVCMRYASASVMQTAAEVIAYGTGVKLK
ncbi:MAG TPA: heavy metal-binding domain-containing protein [Terriglobales bacterium]|nr:heavy metal-binding domain-containing protein [Terriglobales bacterium]